MGDELRFNLLFLKMFLVFKRCLPVQMVFFFCVLGPFFGLNFLSFFVFCSLYLLWVFFFLFYCGHLFIFSFGLLDWR